MKTWHPKSWSAQARAMADKQITQTLRSGNPSFSLHFFSQSYRAPIVRGRAAKRFGRAMKKYGIDIFSYKITGEDDDA